MKRLGQKKHVKHLAERLDGVHALSRARVSERSARGDTWEGLKDNVGLLGISVSKGRPKMVFSAAVR